jgi:hypothetical protein
MEDGYETTYVMSAKQKVTRPLMEGLLPGRLSSNNQGADSGKSLCSRTESTTPQVVAMSARRIRLTNLDKRFHKPIE